MQNKTVVKQTTVGLLTNNNFVGFMNTLYNFMSNNLINQLYAGSYMLFEHKI